MGSSAMVGSYYGARLMRRVSLTTLIAALGWVLLVVGGLLVARESTGDGAWIFS